MFSKCVALPIAIGGLLALTLNSACASGLTAHGATTDPAADHGAGQQPRPLVARQFAEVPDTDWTIDQPLVGREIPCRNGKALIFDCRAVNLLAYLPEHMIGGGDLTSVWGWTDSATQREFVLAVQSNGTSFVEITEPLHPRYLGQLPKPQGTIPSRTRDVKVYRHYAYIVSDGAGPHGLQIFDLTQLRAVTAAPAVFQETAHYDRVANVHTIALDTASGFAFLAGSNGGGETCGGGLHMVDLRMPIAPVFAGCYPETLGGSKGDGYIHETQCVRYHGPDRRYHGREVCVSGAQTAFSIVDVTDTRTPRLLGIAQYPNVSYAHQGWLTEDHRYFFANDEGDEFAQAARLTKELGSESAGIDRTRTRTIGFDLRDLQDPVVLVEFYNPNSKSTDHNLYIRDRYMYQSNYREGLRVVDLDDPAHPMEVGYFDTTPMDENRPGMSGSWGNYPYFTQRGVVAVTTFAPSDDPSKVRHTTKGLFLLRYPSAATRR